MKKFCVLFLFSLVGCGTVSKAPFIYKEEIESNFDEQTKDIGQTLVKYAFGAYSNAIKVSKVFPLESKSLKNTANPTGNFIHEGDILVHHTSVDKTDYYFPENSINRAGVSASKYGIAFDHKTNETLLYLNEGISWTYTRFTQPLEYTITTRPNQTADFQEKSFIYNGKSGNTVKFTYREFSNNQARPEHTQDIQYDLSDSNIIGFQEMRMQILKTSNSSITYKIIKGFQK